MWHWTQTAGSTCLIQLAFTICLQWEIFQIWTVKKAIGASLINALGTIINYDSTFSAQIADNIQY